MALDLIQPLIPNAQENKGPELFMHSLGQGLAAVARFNQMSRDTEMETLKLAEHERVSQEEHQLQRDKMAADADYRDKALEISRDLNEAHINYFNSQADAFKNGTARAWQGATAFNQQREQLIGEVNASANELQLNDPDFATKEPVRYASNVMRFRDMYGLSPLSEVKGAITQFQRTADEQKVSLKIGATFDEESNSWKGGKTQMVPLWKIVKNLADPEQQESTANALEASGHFRVINDFETIQGVKVPRTMRTLEPELESAIQKGKDVKFERTKSRVPAAMLRKSDARGTSGPTAMPQDTSLPDPDLPPVDGDEPQASASPTFEQSETDKLIAQAKAAIAQGASRDRVLAKLQELGIDPNLLMG